MKDDMRGLFFIVKGQYRKGVAPSYMSEVTDSVTHIGGYDPNSVDTTEWYMLRDNKTFNCVSCGSDLNKVLESLDKVIRRHKGSVKRYLKSVERRGATISPATLEQFKHIYDEYGDWFSDEVNEVVESVYEDLKGENVVNKSRKLVSKSKTQVDVVKTKEVVMETSTPKKAKPKVKLGVKKLVM